MIKVIKNTCSFDSCLRYNDEFVLSDFSNFNELNFNCTKPINMSQLTIYPNKKIILDNSFNLNKLTIIPNQNQVSFCIKLFNLKGFQMTNYFDPFNQIKFVNFNKYRKIFYIISQSNFDFFISNNTISINDQCGYLNLTSSKYEWTHFLFNNFAITKFDYSIKYSKHICPLIFRNSFIYHLNLNEISSSFINRNEFEFVNLNVENLCVFTKKSLSIKKLSKLIKT